MLLTIDERDERPIYLQLITQIKEQVGNGVLKPGEELPSVRELAELLGINMHTVRAAYLKLRDQGIITIHLGRRATIAPLRRETKNEGAEAEFSARLKELLTDAQLQGLGLDRLENLINKQLNQFKETVNQGDDHEA